ncbi:MAG: ADP-ribosylglycohydrolase family protein [Micrococcales bacterium]|nr:ADP-ribosylglycohydrolase family protein [Micrococcales bacterium]MCL2667651.1 ADP-ribosylglycohydrolase family protein [Micrococcales bacterium]
MEWDSRRCDGLWGLLVGDALGVPYEFHPPELVPAYEDIELEPPHGFDRSHASAAPGTWSDDGAQALCLLDSLLHTGALDLDDFGARMTAWYDDGLWAVDNQVFDVGVQTADALRDLKERRDPRTSGLVHPNGQGNGALMRVLPLALWHAGDDAGLVRDAGLQALVTHGHVMNQMACAFYCLWARRLLDGHDVLAGWADALAWLRTHESDPDRLGAVERLALDEPPDGGGYVVASFRAARWLLTRCSSYEETVKRAIMLGNDTDTTAAIAGGLAGIVFGGIPDRWLGALRGRDQVEALLAQTSR